MKQENNQIILVADLGGGTLDFSLIKFLDFNSCNVIASKGDTNLGGDDFTEIIYKLIIESILKEHKDFILDIKLKASIHAEAEKAKHYLSFNHSVDIYFPILITKNNDIFDHKMNISRDEFNKASEREIIRISDLISDFLKDKKVKNKVIDKVVLVGGASRMPVFQETIAKITNKKPLIDINPDEIIANGAAYCAEYSTGYEPRRQVIDVTPLGLGVEVIGNIYSNVVPSNTLLPTRKHEIYTTVEDYQEGINFSVFQGERKMASDNIYLGGFNLSGIRRAEKEVPQIKVTFEIDFDGILKVTALDLDTGSSQSINIKDSLEIDDDEIERLRREAKEMIEDDFIKLSYANNVLKLKEYLDQKTIDKDLLSIDEVKVLDRADDCINYLTMKATSKSDMDRENPQLLLYLLIEIASIHSQKIK